MFKSALNRREMLTLSSLLGCGVAGTLGSWFTGAASWAAEPTVEDGTAWYNVADWGVQGRGWDDTQRYFDRLPAKAEDMVRPPVWKLSRHSAGMCARFATDSTTIRARYKLLSPSLAMAHMPATGVSGLDLYGQMDDGRWQWLAVARPNAQEMNVTLAEGILPGRREYLLYLPLYNGVESLEIGVPQDAQFEPVLPRRSELIVYYGTSIAHGACASRPGMAFPSILGRRLEKPVVNLGFSGNGRMDIELADLMGELDAAVYCIDCLPNMLSEDVAAKAEPFVRRLRELKPDTPIVLIEDRTYTNAPLLPQRQERHAASRAALREAYEKLAADRVGGLFYVEGEYLLGDDYEACTDGSHPSDLGMMRMADALEPVLRRVLNWQRPI